MTLYTVLATHTFSYCQVRPVPLAVQTDAKGATLPTVTAGYAVFLRIDAALEYNSSCGYKKRHTHT